MSDKAYSIVNNFQKVVGHLIEQGKRYSKKLISKGKYFGVRGKIQIEIESLKWELKQKYILLGKYVSHKKISKSITDFSHDSNFQRLANDVYKLELYIEEREQEKVGK